MSQIRRVLFVLLVSLGFLELSLAQADTAYTMLRYAFNQLDNQLERHDHRERALGELIKKSLQSLQRGQTNLQQLCGTQTNYDERISQIENQLKTQEERYFSRAEKFFSEQNEINQQLLNKLTKLSTDVENLLTYSHDMVKRHNAKESLDAQIVAGGYPELQNNMTTLQSEEKASVQRLCAQSSSQEGLTYADKEFIQGLASETNSLVESVNTNMQSILQRTQVETVASIKEAEKQSRYAAIDTIIQRFNTQQNLIQHLHNQMISSCIKVNDSVESLSSCNNISQPLTPVMDTVASINNTVIDKQEQLLQFLKSRFDTVDNNISNVQLEMAKNLNATIQNEATYLWRQISVTNGEINANKDLLRLMRDRSDIYVNSVLQSMASISHKVEDINERIMDMNDKQIYMLNKLPLTTQEFSDMQLAFLGWLEQLSETLKIMQEKQKVPAA